MFFRVNIGTLIGRRDWREDVSAYMDGELSERERRRIEARLAESAEMREYLADLEDVRSALRVFEPTQRAAPFQLTPEMLESPRRAALQPAIARGTLRLSMSTAAVGVATFAAVMVFDAMDSPTVTFTTTSAGIASDGIPTAAVVTEEVEIESAESDAGSVGSVQAESSEVVTVASVEAAQAQASDGQQAQPVSEKSAAYVEDGEAQQAAADTSRQAITAGRGGSDTDAAEAEPVSAADVVEQEETASASEQMESSQSEALAAEESSEPVQAANEPAAAEASDESSAPARTETRAVATSIGRTPSDWPLEQRPRSSSVQLARDPSWEAPLQIVLAAIAITATLVWLGLTIVDRRRRI